LSAAAATGDKQMAKTAWQAAILIAQRLEPGAQARPCAEPQTCGFGNEFHGAVVLWKLDDSYIKAEEVCGFGITAKIRKPAINFGAILAAATIDDDACITFGDYKLTKELNANILKAPDLILFNSTAANELPHL